MHLLYLDDSGSVTDSSQRHFILAGIALFERQTHWLQKELDNLVDTLGHPYPDQLELHGNQILAGCNWWRGVPREQRRDVIRQGLELAFTLRGQWRLFSAVVDKQSLSPRDPVGYAFEQLCSRFDQFLRRLHLRGDSQRGLIILDRARRAQQEMRLQSLASEFKGVGHTWGVTRNLADVPLFVDSRATRIIQYADLVAYALWRKFEKGDDESSDFDSTLAQLQQASQLHEDCNAPFMSAADGSQHSKPSSVRHTTDAPTE